CEDSDVRQHRLRPVREWQQLAVGFGDVGAAHDAHPAGRLRVPMASRRGGAVSTKSALRPRYLKVHAVIVFAFLFAPIIVVMVILLTAFFRRFAHIDLSIRTVIAAHITFCIAFVVVVVKARLTAFDNRLVEAAADLGATPLQAFLRVVLPLAAPGIFAGAMLAFTITLDDVGITSSTTSPS